MDQITNTHMHLRQAVYCDIGDRGIRVDYAKIKLAKIKIKKLIEEQLLIPSAQWNMKVFIGKDSVGKTETNCVNLNATAGERALLAAMKNLGYNVPKITKKNEDGEYERKYSTGELALQKMLTENQFKYPAGDPAIRAILRVREYGKLLSQYLNARFLPVKPSEGEEDLYYFLASYNVGGTTSGRRNSKRHTFGFGGNAQNFPSHSDIAWIFRECLIPREGHIFLNVDQCQAEDWPVSALSNNIHALTELQNGVDRHSALATFIFGEKVPPKGSPEWDKKKHEFFRYMGKKTRHAGNYGMGATRMSESLAQEGKSVSKATCEMLLAKASAADPNVKGVFHKYVQEQLSDKRMLKTPFGRERYFLGARPNSDNSTLFNEAYAYIPQSTVGDLTGFAVVELETLYPKEERFIIQECHDSICQDVPEDYNMVLRSLRRVEKAFDRKIRFYNGISIRIPVEADLGFDMNTKVEFKDLSESSLKIAFEKIREKREEKRKKDLVELTTEE